MGRPAGSSAAVFLLPLFYLVGNVVSALNRIGSPAACRSGDGLTDVDHLALMIPAISRIVRSSATDCARATMALDVLGAAFLTYALVLAPLYGASYALLRWRKAETQVLPVRQDAPKGADVAKALALVHMVAWSTLILMAFDTGGSATTSRYFLGVRGDADLLRYPFLLAASMAAATFQPYVWLRRASLAGRDSKGRP